MRKLLNSVLILLLLSGCVSDDDDARILFQLFPDGYFSLGYQEQYNLIGTSNSGATFQGTHLVLNEGNVMFNGQNTNSLRIQNNWTDMNNTPFANGVTQYFTTDENDRKLLGTEDLFTSEVFVFSSPGTFPLSAEIGDSGVVGIEINSANETVTNTWSLIAGSGQLAILVFATEIRDDSNDLIFEGNTTYVIQRDGERQSMGILFDVKAFADPVTWLGTRI